MKKALTFILFLFTVHSGNAQNIVFKNIGIKEGLSQLSVYSIYQDEPGRMWFGTRQGINLYDGKNVQQISLAESNTLLNLNNTIWKVTGDHEKNIIYFLMDRTLISYNIQSQRQETLSNEVHNFFYIDSTLFLTRYNQLLTFDPESRKETLVLKLDAQYTSIKDMYLSENDEIWLATNQGVVIHSKTTRENTEILKNKPALCFKQDSKDNLWIGTGEDGLISIDQETKQIIDQFSQLENREIRCIEEDNSGNLWIGTFYGLFHLDMKKSQLSEHLPIDKTPYTLSNSSIYSLYKDRQGTIWVGTYFGGINYFNPESDIYELYSASSYDANHVSYPIIGNITEDNRGNLWVCTEGGGLNAIDLSLGEITVYKHLKDDNSIPHNNLKSIWFDKNHNNLFIGTHTGGLSVLNTETKKFTNFIHDPNNPRSLPNNVVNKMTPYQDYLLLLTQDGVSAIHLETLKIVMLEEALGNSAKEFPKAVQHIYTDGKERLWYTDFSGRLYRFQPNEPLKTYKHESGNDNSFPIVLVNDMFEDKKGMIYLATEGEGILIYNEVKDHFEQLNLESGHLISNNCYRLQQSKSGYLITTSEKGITFFDPNDMTTFHIRVPLEIPLTGIIQENGLYISAEGNIYIGGVDGLIKVNEGLLFKSIPDYTLFFTNISINNQEIAPDDETKILNKNVTFTNKLELNHDQNNLIFEFSSSNYISHFQRTFEYRLFGLDDKWISLDYPVIQYTNINPGKYTLEIREKQRNPSDTIRTLSMEIAVKPPFYASPLAFVIYLVLFIAIALIIALFNHSKALLKAKVTYEQKEKQRIEELNQTKLRFFTNISHEFRTPLTLILSQIELLLQNNQLNNKIFNQIGKIEKHAQHMLQLISELMDFRKHEHGELKIQVQKINLTNYINEIYQSFQNYALQKEIHFIYEHSNEVIDVWLDPEQIQKVIYNLISNAFKFTEPNGSIRIHLRKKSQSVVLEVSDTGKGIDSQHIPYIFNRYYQINLPNQSELSSGTGIGLALAKGIVELHSGIISVDSTIGKGSTFYVELKLGYAHYKDDQIITDLSYDQKSLNAHQPTNPDSNVDEELIEVPKNDDKRPTIAIIEDNEDLLALLKELFSPLYNVVVATNGSDGYDLIKQILPDIVLSDVMMSKMTGTEVCKKIKNNMELCHIPVVLLTAKGTSQQISEGYLAGADDYVTKPFNAKTLIIRCNNLIKNRNILQKKFSAQTNTSDNPFHVIASNRTNQKSLEKIKLIIDKNLDNPNFNVDILAREAGIGRSKLYEDIKEITNMTPNEYILNIKMTYAAEWLKNDSSITISEIAYKLGFSSARYFSRCVKNHFGIPPKEIRK